EPLLGPHGARDGVFYSPQPLGPDGRVAFVYPGSGNEFTGMGRDIGLAWPEVLRRQDRENACLRSQYLPGHFWNESPRPPSLCAGIFAQVALGTLVTDVLGSLGVQPAAAIGYSLGESSALFALRVWADRDGMLQAMTASPLFAEELAGGCRAARAAWRLG